MKTFINPLKKTLPRTLLCHLLIISACTLGLSCEKTEHQEYDNELGQINVTNTHVILTPKHIVGLKFERYQPSLTLYGSLKPVLQQTIVSPQRIKLLEVLVNDNQKVKKDQPLVRYLVAPHLQTANIQTESLQTADIQEMRWQTTNDNQALPMLQNNSKPSQEIALEENQEKNSKLFEATTELPSKLPNQLSPQVPPPSTFSINAPFKGMLQHVYYNQEKVFYSFFPTIVEKGQPILMLHSDNEWEFTSIVLKDPKSKLSIGQHVNFAVFLPHDSPTENRVTLTGQISAITPTDNVNLNSVKINVLTEKNHPVQLKLGMKVQGKVDRGQMKVGTLVNKMGVHEISNHHLYGNSATDLSIFTESNTDIIAPTKAFVWTVGHDRKLKRQIVDVIRYHQQSGQYLVTGIPNEVLICLITLPNSTEGKIVKVS